MTRFRALKGRRQSHAIRVQLVVYSGVLILLAFASWMGDGWGYFVLYGLVLTIFVLVVSASWVGVRWRSGDASRARAFVGRSLGSFVKAQITLAAALVAAAVFAQSRSGPLGPFHGRAFEGTPSEELVAGDLVIERNEVQLQIPADPPYTINTHAFVIDGSLYVGADFTFPFKRWVYIVQGNPNVLVRIGEELFRSRAVQIENELESRRILEEVSRRRGVDANDWLTEVWFFRMDPW